ncbi:MAG: hypothetical protein D4S00_08185 [Streptomycetaceae bacterium]|nr:MAG: hypothetical protein D4S00_08185 [Streptomycetaceae bacterium]
MRFIYSALFGAMLALGSIFLHASLAPFGLILSLLATGVGIWSIGRTWGGRSLRIIASTVWIAIVLRAGFPGGSDEYLIEGSAIGISLINGGFLVLVLAVLIPA